MLDPGGLSVFQVIQHILLQSKCFDFEGGESLGCGNIDNKFQYFEIKLRQSTSNQTAEFNFCNEIFNVSQPTVKLQRK